jgi:hypothetical protein
MTTKPRTAVRKTTPADSEVSDISSWKKKDQAIRLPSGQRMKLKRVGLQSFIASGTIPNSLMGIVQKSLSTGQEADLSGLDLTNQDTLRDMLKMVDDVVITCAVEPPVNPLPTKDNGHGAQIPDPEGRDDETLYVDEVDDEDKMFIFQWTTGGTADVEQFRKESADSLAIVQRSQKVGVPPKRAARGR